MPRNERFDSVSTDETVYGEEDADGDITARWNEETNSLQILDTSGSSPTVLVTYPFGKPNYPNGLTANGSDVLTVADEGSLNAGSLGSFDAALYPRIDQSPNITGTWRFETATEFLPISTDIGGKNVFVTNGNAENWHMEAVENIFRLYAPGGAAGFLEYDYTTGDLSVDGGTGVLTTDDEGSLDAGTLDGSDSSGYLSAQNNDTTDGIVGFGGAGSITQTLGSSSGESARFAGSNSDLLVNIQGGHGRVAIAWNAYYDTENSVWRSIVANEPHALIAMMGVNPGNGNNNGNITLAVAGENTSQDATISWTEHTFYQDGTTNIDAAAVDGYNIYVQSSQPSTSNDYIWFQI